MRKQVLRNTTGKISTLPTSSEAQRRGWSAPCSQTRVDEKDSGLQEFWFPDVLLKFWGKQGYFSSRQINDPTEKRPLQVLQK